MVLDRVAPSIFVGVLLLACGDSNFGTPGNLSLGDTDAGSGAGTNSYLASGQCPPLGTKICPNDQATVQSDVDNCNHRLNDPSCSGAFKTFLECLGNNVVCDSTGQSDSNAISAACDPSAQQFQTCLSVNETDGG